MAAKKQSPKLKKKSKGRTRTQDPAQSARFLEIAKSLDVDETGEAFERALKVIATPPKSAKKRG
jgi:hypothetical protein